jgi:hypothetical protein
MENNGMSLIFGVFTSFLMRENDDRMIKINYLDERKWVVKRDDNNDVGVTKSQWHPSVTP